MDAPHIRCRWTGEALVPLGHSASLAREAMQPGDVVIAAIERPRSMASHNHQFAWIADAWAHMPERLQAQPWAANPEAMRKHALIATGYSHSFSVDCGTKAAAERVLPRLVEAERRASGYAIGQVRGPVVTVWTPESQSVRAMGGKRFRESKDAILGWITQQFGFDPTSGEVTA